MSPPVLLSLTESGPTISFVCRSQRRCLKLRVNQRVSYSQSGAMFADSHFG